MRAPNLSQRLTASSAGGVFRLSAISCAAQLKRRPPAARLAACQLQVQRAKSFLCSFRTRAARITRRSSGFQSPAGCPLRIPRAWIGQVTWCPADSQTARLVPMALSKRDIAGWFRAVGRAGDDTGVGADGGGEGEGLRAGFLEGRASGRPRPLPDGLDEFLSSQRLAWPCLVSIRRMDTCVSLGLVLLDCPSGLDSCCVAGQSGLVGWPTRSTVGVWAWDCRRAGRRAGAASSV